MRRFALLNDGSEQERVALGLFRSDARPHRLAHDEAD